MEVKKIVKLTNDQYSDLLINGEIIVDGEVKHWEDDVLYISDSALETVELRNMIDKGLVKPNKLSHTQFITPKVKELIKEIEYPDGYLHIPDYEWNYLIIKGKMTKGDYFHYQPVADDNFGKVMIWNNAEWQELSSNYECTTDDEEEVMLKFYPTEYGYNKTMKVSRNSVNMDIEDLGVHMTKDNHEGSVQYMNVVDYYDLTYITPNLYIYGNVAIDDTIYPNKVIKLEIDGNVNVINFTMGFTSLQYLKVNKINRVDNTRCPNLKEIDCNFIYDYNFTTLTGYETIRMWNLEKIPKCRNINSNAFYGAAKQISLVKNLDLILNYPVTLGSQAFYGSGFNYVYLGEEVEMANSNIFQGAITTKVDIYCKNISTYSFYNSGYLIDVFLSNKVETLGNNPFIGCSYLTNVILEDGFNATGLNLSSSTRFPEEVMLAWIVALKDNTGSPAKTLLIGTTNKNKFINKKISYADDLGKWEFDTGYYQVDNVEINKPYRVSGRPSRLNDVYDYVSRNSYTEGTDYTYENGYITFIKPSISETSVGINYTTTATMNCQTMASQKNWTIS